MICHRIIVKGVPTNEVLVKKNFESKDEAKGFFTMIEKADELLEGLPFMHLTVTLEEMYLGEWVVAETTLISLKSEAKE